MTWQKEGYEPQGVPHPADARREPSIDKHGNWLIPRKSGATGQRAEGSEVGAG